MPVLGRAQVAWEARAAQLRSEEEGGDTTKFPFPCPPSEDTEKQVGQAARLGGIFVKEQPGDEYETRNPPEPALVEEGGMLV